MDNIMNFMLGDQLVYFGAILCLNIFSSCIGTLKSIYTAKQAGKITYLMVMLDATVYSLVLKSFASDGSLAVVAFIIGKLFGTVLADMFEKKIAIGINNVCVYIGSYDQTIIAQRQLIEDGFSTTISVDMVNENKKRFSLNIHVARKNMKDLMQSLQKVGIIEPTMTIQELKTVSGKIAERI
jgi:uncharacterized protein YebE (UPF0316 family)